MREALLGSVGRGRFQASGPLNRNVGVCLDAFSRSRKVGLGGSSAARASELEAESELKPSPDSRRVDHDITTSMGLAAGAGARGKHYSAFDSCWPPVLESS